MVRRALRRMTPPSMSAAKRFVERFGLIALALYHIPLFLNNYPSLGGGGFNDTGLAPRWGHVFTAPSIWVARHLFHIAGPMTQARNGDNGDVGEEFARLLLAIVIGLGVALGASTKVEPLLFNTSSHDPLVYSGVAVMLVLVALCAGIIPARRASRVDPSVALRAE